MSNHGCQSSSASGAEDELEPDIGDWGDDEDEVDTEIEEYGLDPESL